MDKITIILAIELLAIKDLNTKIPVRVKTDAIKDNFEKNCSSNFKTSISNQESPGPGPGIARKTKTIIAVPTMVKRRLSGSSLISFIIRNKTIPMDPKKTIS